MLARAIFKEGMPQHRRRQQSDGRSPRHRQGRRSGDRALDNRWPSRSSSKDEIAQVGAISANNDNEIGDLLADAMEKVGKDGVITVEEGKTTETTLEFVEGMQFDKGFISPYFINRPAEMDCVLEDALILIHEKKISNLRELVPILEKVAQSGKPLLIIAEDVEGEALTALVVNKLRGVLNICAVKAPASAIAARPCWAISPSLTGGTLISEDLGMKLENLDARAAGPRQEDHGRQEQHHDRRRRRQAGRHPEPHRADSQPDRSHRQRLRSREVPGTPGQADRRRGDHFGRRRHAKPT